MDVHRISTIFRRWKTVIDKHSFEDDDEKKVVIITIRRQIVFERCVDNRFIVDMRTTTTIAILRFRSIFIRTNFHQMAQGTLSLGGERITGNYHSAFQEEIHADFRLVSR